MGDEATRQSRSGQHNLPTQLTSFVGRERELAELAELLDSTRLLTVTGTGGCGKTRLALRLASQVLERFPNGVWWIELAPVSDPELVEAALAAALGVRPLPGRTALEAAVLHLSELRALVLLDNCEHVLERCRRITADLLRGCPSVTVVATSREPLGLGGETTWRVPSLSLPPPGHAESVSSLQRSDAAALFIERAVKVRPNFAVTPATAPHVAQICDELNGIPLAIELAAARVRVLSIDRIASELGDRFHLLTGGERGALPRLQTLRASVDWSHELLATPERALLRRCSVFQGGFTLDACEAVCAGDDVERYAVLDVLTSLVDKSLVLVEEREFGSRYALLETIRQYALERLVDAREVSLVRDRHADAFLALAEDAAPILGTAVGPSDMLATDAANLYAAIDHTVHVEPELALRLCTALAYWWLLTGRLTEGPSALARALEATAGRRSELRCSALFWRGYLEFFKGDYELTLQLELEALELAQDLGDRVNEARVLSTLGLLGTRIDPRGALAGLERSRALAREVGDDWCVAEATQNVGWALLLIGESERARLCLDESYESARRFAYGELVAWHWLMVGHLLYPTGDHDAARRLWERSLDGASDVQDGLTSWSLGLLEVAAGEPHDALVRLEACQRRMISAGAGLSLPFLKAAIGVARAALGQLEHAQAELSDAVDEHSHGFAWAQTMALIDLAHVERLRGDHLAATDRAEQALALAEHLGHLGLAAGARHSLAGVAFDLGDLASAEQLAHQALGAQAERGDHRDIPDSLDMLAELAAALDSHVEAARLLGAAERARADLGLVRWKPDQDRVDALVDRLRDALGEEPLASSFSSGRALTITDAVNYARRARGTRKRPPTGWESLTPTELDVVRHAAAGLTNPEIAERMFIARGTVKVHLSHIYAKLGLRNRSEVAAEAMRRRQQQQI